MGAPYISRNLKQFRLVEMTIPDIFKEESFRITVDESRDYELMSELYHALWTDKAQIIDLVQALSWLKSHPRTADRNKNVMHSAINQKVQKQFREQKYLSIVGKWEYGLA